MTNPAPYVKVAFNDPAQTPVWTDITPYVLDEPGVDINRSKRSSILEGHGTGECSFTVDDRDARFDPMNLTGPYRTTAYQVQQLSKAMGRYHAGRQGGYIQTPGHADFALGDTLDVRIRVMTYGDGFDTLLNGTPIASSVIFVSHTQDANFNYFQSIGIPEGWVFGAYVHGDGNIFLAGHVRDSVTGGYVSVISSVELPGTITTHKWVWLRMFVDSKVKDGGGSGHHAKFYYSFSDTDDGDAVSWTQLGTAVLAAMPGVWYLDPTDQIQFVDSSAPIRLGWLTGLYAWRGFDGAIQASQLITDGDTCYKVTFNGDYAEGDTTVTDLDGHVWTPLNGARMAAMTGIKPYRRVQVGFTWTPPGGVETDYPRFTGFIESWPIGDTNQFKPASRQITALDIRGILATVTNPISPWVHTIKFLRPLAWYRMDEIVSRGSVTGPALVDNTYVTNSTNDPDWINWNPPEVALDSSPNGYNARVDSPGITARPGSIGIESLDSSMAGGWQFFGGPGCLYAPDEVSIGTYDTGTEMTIVMLVNMYPRAEPDEGPRNRTLWYQGPAWNHIYVRDRDPDLDPEDDSYGGSVVFVLDSGDDGGVRSTVGVESFITPASTKRYIVDDQELHLIVARYSAGVGNGNEWSMSLRIDKMERAKVVIGTEGDQPMLPIVGGDGVCIGGRGDESYQYDGAMSNFVFFNRYLSDLEVLAIETAYRGSWYNDAAGARINRLIGFSSSFNPYGADFDIDDGVTVLDTPGPTKSSLNVLTELSDHPITDIDRVVEAERGSFFVTADGVATFLGRHRFALADMAYHTVMLDPAPRSGDNEGAWNSGTTYAKGEVVFYATHNQWYESKQGSNTNHAPGEIATSWWRPIVPYEAASDSAGEEVINVAVVERSSGGSFVSESPASVASFQMRSASLTIPALDSYTPTDVGTWIIQRFAFPTPYTTGVALKPYGHTGAIEACLSIDLEHRVRLRRHLPSGTLDQQERVLGIREVIRKGEWGVALTFGRLLDETDRYLVVGDTTLGKLNNNRVGY